MTFEAFREAATRWRVGSPLPARLALGGCFLVVVAAAACAPGPAGEGAGASLTVAAAADLQFAFQEIGPLFERETGARVTFLFGSSGVLEKQIENGAPVDLFASAGEEYLRQLDSRGSLVPGTEQLYGLGRIALVSSRASGVQAATLEDLAKPEVRHLALANPDHAPYGAAARQALEAAGLWERIGPKVVYGENVRQALQFVQTGNAEAGIVALSIAEVPEVERAEVAAALYRPLRQSMAVVKGTHQEGLARAFAAFVNGPKGRPVMKRYGFALPGEG